MRTLLDKHPELKSITIMRVDWDTHSDSPIVRDLNVPRRSTLVMFKGGQEVARVVAQTDETSLEGLLRAGI